MLVAYVTGHGYGHLVRLCEVLRQVRARAPGLALTLVGEVPERLVRDELPGPVAIRRVACDAGLAQRDALHIDEEESARRCRELDARFDERVREESELLRAAGARAVLGDIPPLAFAAAARAGVPSLALGNFSWDWIYRHLSVRQPSLAGSAARAAAAYAEAGLLLALPFAGDLSSFPRRVEVGLVARRPRLAREEARRLLGLDGRPAVLLSFGGLGLPGLSRSLLSRERDLAFLLPEDAGGERLAALGLAYPDLVQAADVVVTKPGYGIVSDAIAAGTRLVYTERGDFPEYEVMVRELPAWLACAHVSNAELFAGRLAGPVERVLSLPMPPRPDLDGAARAAEQVLAAIG
ncbi:MAG TPA: hypothetical protein VFE30_01530 [Anaeromyxobacteraceae bacterium]|jgi:L-arabinokinase|nr:hypothetical protein [Anaeromyxobacteraceae bacterium]